ncbi:hypothetical protein CERZMDRAFT_89281 [Cercospora zeae-maydis SCOH1-5]|uniref:Uncharacterized protein n=1 Tax=Cercospora zeae-maydis SCOH1-5 TaxID=717836 RepID=A0A6A6EVY2_9PEZI|nr:hypothetical protein CERZMDRAFT_89281 [Cercospora zeae-maydis SCOH1-5]
MPKTKNKRRGRRQLPLLSEERDLACQYAIGVIQGKLLYTIEEIGKPLASSRPLLAVAVTFRPSILFFIPNVLSKFRRADWNQGKSPSTGIPTSVSPLPSPTPPPPSSQPLIISRENTVKWYCHRDIKPQNRLPSGCQTAEDVGGGRAVSITCSPSSSFTAIFKTPSLRRYSSLHWHSSSSYGTLPFYAQFADMCTAVQLLRSHCTWRRQREMVSVVMRVGGGGVGVASVESMRFSLHNIPHRPDKAGVTPGLCKTTERAAAESRLGERKAKEPHAHKKMAESEASRLELRYNIAICNKRGRTPADEG